MIIIVLGMLIAYLSVRRRNAITNLIDTLAMFPYIVPGSVLGIPLLLAALIRHKMVWMRTLCAPCAAILIQLAAAAYVVICQNDAVDFTPIIRLFSTGCGALMLCGTAVDAIRFAVKGEESLARKTAVKTASHGRKIR